MVNIYMDGDENICKILNTVDSFEAKLFSAPYALKKILALKMYFEKKMKVVCLTVFLYTMFITFSQHTHLMNVNLYIQNIFK